MATPHVLNPKLLRRPTRHEEVAVRTIDLSERLTVWARRHLTGEPITSDQAEQLQRVHDALGRVVREVEAE